MHTSEREQGANQGRSELARSHLNLARPNCQTARFEHMISWRKAGIARACSNKRACTAAPACLHARGVRQASLRPEDD